MSDTVITEEKMKFCVSAAAVVTHWSYRLMQLVHIFLSIASIVLLIHVIIYTVRKLLVHSNIKTLILLLYVACLLHAILVATFQTHHLITSLVYSNPCDLILPTWVYCIYHIPFSASVMWIENIQILMYIERAIATFYVKRYEYSAVWMAKYYIIASFALPLFGEFWMNDNEEWMNEWQISALNTPKNNAFRMNILMGSLSALNVLLVASTLWLNRVNRRNEEKAKFLAVITSGQLFLFAIYGTTTMIVRMNCDNLNSMSITYKTIILMAYTVPIYTLLLPVFSLYTMVTKTAERRASIDALVQIKYVGQEGWNNYLMFIIPQWN